MKNYYYRVYVIDTEVSTKPAPNTLTDLAFMAEAETLGTVYTLKGFQNAFNDIDVNPSTDYLRIIKHRRK